MKKIVCLVVSMLCLSGCFAQEKDEEEKSLTCTGSRDVQGLQAQIISKVKSVGDLVTSQTNITIINLVSDDVVNALEPQVKDLEAKYANKEGLIYTVNLDKTNKTMTETFVFDYNKLDASTYNLVTGSTEDKKASGKIKLSMENTHEQLLKSGLSCE